MWTEITEEQYLDALDILPPAIVTPHGFLQGEPFDFRTCRITRKFRATYSAYVEYKNKFYSGGNLTVAEFEAFKPEDLSQ